MFAPGQNQLLANLSLLLFFKDLSIVRFYDFKKNFRGMCFTVQLSKIIFRIAVCHKQLCYYIMLFSACQELFSTFLKLFLFLSCSNSDMLSHPTSCCQELFYFFFAAFFARRNSYILSRVFSDVKNFFISFFIQRRRRDLNPRTAQTVYTLSRGTSSAT